MDPGRGLMHQLIEKAKDDPKRVVFPESYDERVVKAASILASEEIAHPVLIGKRDAIAEIAEAKGLSLDGIEIIDPPTFPRIAQYTENFALLMQRRGMTRPDARRRMFSQSRFALMMLREGYVDCMVTGATRPYGEAIKPVLQMVGSDGGKCCGMYMLLTRTRTLFFADTTVQIDPSAEELADITMRVVARVRSFDIVPSTWSCARPCTHGVASASRPTSSSSRTSRPRTSPIR
jgi:malate dehydrogenase (oxaloacetate-decarboxylating)(NADP+)